MGTYFIDVLALITRVRAVEQERAPACVPVNRR
jgi:hypothetical protein